MSEGNGLCLTEIPAGSSVIVYVDPPNKPVGWWFGQTTGNAAKHGSLFRVPVILKEPAEVTDAALGIDYRDMSPTPTCWVYSDTREIRQLIYWQILARNRHNNRMRELESRVRGLQELQDKFAPLVGQLIRLVNRALPRK